MPKLDDLIREELREAAPRPEMPEDIFDRLGARKRRRKVARRAMSGVLAAAVLAATAGAFVALDRAFTGGKDEIANPPTLKENGDLLVTVPDDGGSHIYRLPADSIPGPGEDGATQADLENVWFEEGPVDQYGAAVSPDGSTVVFEDPSIESSTLWSVGIDGSDPTRLTPPSLDASQPAWSPDGRQIAFVGTDEGLSRRIFVMNADGSEPRAITNDEVSLPFTPTWSPDGSRIAFSAIWNLEGAVTFRRIFTMLPDGSDLERLELPVEVPPRGIGNPIGWSPDGRAIVFADAGIKLLDIETGEVTTLTDPVAEGLPGADTGDAYDTDPAWSPDGTLVVFSRFDRVDHSVVYAVGADGSGLPYPLVVGRDPAWQPLPSAPPSQSPIENLGLGTPICRVTSMPVGTVVGSGVAYVFTEAPGGDCPKRGEGVSRVGVDLDADDRVDTTAGPLADCYFQCEAFAAPDVDADGVSEIAVSTAGADGYGVWLYSISSDPAALLPVVVDNPDGIGSVRTGPLEFAWVGAAAHREDAVCAPLEGGSPAFIVRSTEVGTDDATMRTTTMLLDGAQATVVAADTRTIPLEDVPGPGSRICGAPLYNSAAGFPGAEIEGKDIGLESRVCQAEMLGGLDLVPDGTADIAWAGYLVNQQGRCPQDAEAQEWIVAIDVTGDGLADASTAIPDTNCPYVSCAPLGGTDLDADGDQELIVNTFFSIIDHSYFAIGQTDAGVSIDPILVAAPGNPAAAIDPGEPLETSAAGDEGFAGWIRCENYPESPVLVATWGYSAVGSDQPAEWHETKLQLQDDGVFHVIATNDFELPPREDPGLIRSEEPACGINFNFWMNPPGE